MPGRTAPQQGTPTYRQVWRVVDGAVREALRAHPDYVAPGHRPGKVRNSITKRVTGAICGYAEQSAWVRSGCSPADKSTASRLTEDVAEGPVVRSSGGEAVLSLPATHSVLE